MERVLEKHTDALADLNGRMIGHEQRAVSFDEKLDALLSVAERTDASVTSLRGAHDQRMAIVAERDRARAARDTALGRWKVAALGLAGALFMFIAGKVFGW